MNLQVDFTFSFPLACESHGTLPVPNCEDAGAASCGADDGLALPPAVGTYNMP
jgi:hypothetical protein